MTMKNARLSGKLILITVLLLFVNRYENDPKSGGTVCCLAQFKEIDTNYCVSCFLAKFGRQAWNP